MIQLKILQVQMLLMLYHISSLLRIIPIKDNDKFKSNKLELGVITINLSNIRSTDGTQFATYINSSYFISFSANKVITAIFKFIFTYIIFKFYQIE